MRKNRMGVFLILLAFTLSGCGKHPDDNEIAEDLKQYDIEEDETVGSGDTAGIPNHIKETIVGENGYEYVIDADVVSDGYSDAAVYEMTMPEPTDALVKQYADNVFDNSEYTVVKPYENMSLEELQAEDAFLGALMEMEENGEAVLSSDIYLDAIYVGEKIAGYTGDDVTEIPEGQLLFEEHVAQGEYGEEETLTRYTARLRGKVDGAWWELSFNGESGNNRMIFRNLEYAQTVHHYVMEDEMSDVIYGANASDKKACEMAADNFIGKLGYEDMALAHAGNIVSEDADGKEGYLNGYRFVYTRKLGMQVGFSTENMVYIEAPESYESFNPSSYVSEGKGAVQEYVWLEVADGRVYSVQIDNIFEVGKQMSDKTVLLDFEQIMDIAREQIKMEIDHYEAAVGSVKTTMSGMELRYLVIPYGEERYSMVPVWILYEAWDMGYDDVCFSRYGINAIDGSLVLFTNY